MMHNEILVTENVPAEAFVNDAGFPQLIPYNLVILISVLLLGGFAALCWFLFGRLKVHKSRAFKFVILPLILFGLIGVIVLTFKQVPQQVIMPGEGPGIENEALSSGPAEIEFNAGLSWIDYLIIAVYAVISTASIILMAWLFFGKLKIHRNRIFQFGCLPVVFTSIVGAVSLFVMGSQEQFVGMSGDGFRIGMAIAIYEWLTAALITGLASLTAFGVMRLRKRKVQE